MQEGAVRRGFQLRDRQAREQQANDSYEEPLHCLDQRAQVLLVYVVFQAYALDHHQPNQAGYTGVGFAGYAAAPAPYGRYDAYASPPHPYNFGYDNVDEYGNRQFRNEQGDFNNAKTGSYGYRDANGLYRRVNYVADANGFRATVDTNEPGTAPGASADAVFNAAPVVPPVPSGAAQIGAPTAFAARAASAYNAGGYSGYGRYGYNPYAGAAAAHGNDAYGCQGYAASGPALGGYAYGGSVPYGYRDAGYAASYALGGYGAPVGYGSWPSAHHGHRRR
nr:pupal cuticle protein 36-like isoform X2 [Dermacentor andersoni]